MQIRFKGLWILFLYFLVTLAIVAALFRFLVPERPGWIGFVVWASLVSKPDGTISSLDTLLFAIWFLWPAWYFCWLPISQGLAAPLLLGSSGTGAVRSWRFVAATIASGMIAAWLVVGAFVMSLPAVPDAVLSDFDTVLSWAPLATGLIVCVGWTFYCLRKRRDISPLKAYAQQSRLLLWVSMVWLLVACLLFVFPGGRGLDEGYSVLIGGVCTLGFALQPAVLSFFMARCDRREQRAARPTRQEPTV